MLHSKFDALDEDSATHLQRFFEAYGAAVRASAQNGTRALAARNAVVSHVCVSFSGGTQPSPHEFLTPRRPPPARARPRDDTRENSRFLSSTARSLSLFLSSSWTMSLLGLIASSKETSDLYRRPLGDDEQMADWALRAVFDRPEPDRVLVAFASAADVDKTHDLLR